MGKVFPGEGIFLCVKNENEKMKNVWHKRGKTYTFKNKTRTKGNKMNTTESTHTIHYKVGTQ